MSTATREMGKVLTTIVVTNRIDQALAARGLIPADQVRSVTLPEVLVDTGAMMLCLPSAIIRQLGLEPKEEVGVETATGFARAHIYRDATIELEGRSSTFDCLELPGGTSPLLGVIPMEMMGLEPDLKNQRLRVLPNDTSDTYLTIL
jgi:predicted aspartyl protease